MIHGKHPSVASLYRVLAEADDQQETEADATGPPGHGARIAGHGSRTDPELMERLQRQVLDPQP